MFESVLLSSPVPEVPAASAMTRQASSWWEHGQALLFESHQHRHGNFTAPCWFQAKLGNKSQKHDIFLEN